MVIYTRRNFNLLDYLSHGIRTYCCGYGKDHTPAWVSKLSSGVHGNIYHVANHDEEYVHLTPNECVEQLSIIEQSTNAVYCYADDKHLSQTLILMGYGLMCPHVTSVVYLDLQSEQGIELVTTVAHDHQIDICTTMEQLINYLLAQWKDVEVTHLLLEREVVI